MIQPLPLNVYCTLGTLRDKINELVGVSNEITGLVQRLQAATEIRSTEIFPLQDFIELATTAMANLKLEPQIDREPHEG